MLFNYTEALARADGNHELLSELAWLFCRHYRQRLEEIQQAVASEDGQRLASAAGRLRTSVCALTAQSVCDVLLALETMGVNGDLMDADDGLHELEDRLAQLDRELLEYRKVHV